MALPLTIDGGAGASAALAPGREPARSTGWAAAAAASAGLGSARVALPEAVSTGGLFAETDTVAAGSVEVVFLPGCASDFFFTCRSVAGFVARGTTAVLAGLAASAGLVLVLGRERAGFSATGTAFGRTFLFISRSIAAWMTSVLGTLYVSRPENCSDSVIFTISLGKSSPVRSGRSTPHFGFA